MTPVQILFIIISNILYLGLISSFCISGIKKFEVYILFCTIGFIFFITFFIYKSNNKNEKPTLKVDRYEQIMSQQNHEDTIIEDDEVYEKIVNDTSLKLPKNTEGFTFFRDKDKIFLTIDKKSCYHISKRNNCYKDIVKQIQNILDRNRITSLILIYPKDENSYNTITIKSSRVIDIKKYL